MRREDSTMASSDGASNGLTSSNGTSTPISHNYDSDKSENIEDNEIELESRCMVCQQAYCDPRLLSCLHTFCCSCMDSMIFVENDQKFIKCRRCKYTTKLPNNSVEQDLSRNPALMRYTEKLTFNAEDGLTCRSCKGKKPAVARCFECPNYLCETCVQSHKSLKFFDGHKIYSLAETRTTQSSETLFCKASHRQLATASYYCHSCRAEYCDHCILQDHSGCTRTSIQYTLQDPVFSLNHEWRDAMTRESYYSDNLRTLNASLRISMEDLEKFKETMIKIIEERCQFLKEQVLNKLYNDARAIGQSQYQSFAKYNAQLCELIKFMTYQNGKAHPWDIAKMRTFIEQRMEDVNRMKPQDLPMSSTLEFHPGDLSMLGTIGSVTLNASITTQNTTTNPPKPIARPTITRQENYNRRGSNGYTSNQSLSYGVMPQENRPSYGYSHNSYNGYNQNQVQRYGSREAYNLTTAPAAGAREAYNRSPVSVQQTFHQAGNFQIDHFQLPASNGGGSLGSPMSVRSHMSVSQPNSANLPNDSSVFNFNALSLSDSSSVWQPASSVAVGQGYPAWSVGSDQPPTQQPLLLQPQDPSFALADPQQPNDVFAHPGMFEMPAGSAACNKPPKIKRMQMNYFKKFGEYGNERGDFTEPSGICVDHLNRLVVADTNNNRIQVFSVTGEWLHTIDGQSMQFPNRITVSKKTGRIVVTERAPTRRIQVFDPNGRYLTAFGEDFLQHPRGITLDDYDNIIVIECKVMRVNIFTIDGTVLHKWGASEHLLFPNSVAVNSKQEIFISDNRDTGIKVFDYVGNYLRKIGGPGITDFPIAVAINNMGEVVVADNHNNFNITVFTQDGQLIEGFESKGRHAQCFDVALTNDGVAVVSSKDFKVFCYPYKMTCPYIQHAPHEYIHPKDERSERSYRRN